MVGRPSSSRTSSDHGDGRLALKEDVEVAAKTEVLGSLADVEADPRLAFAGVAAVELHDAVFQAQTRQGSFERAVFVHDDIGPALNDVGGAERSVSARPGRRLPVKWALHWGSQRRARR